MHYLYTRLFPISVILSHSAVLPGVAAATDFVNITTPCSTDYALATASSASADTPATASSIASPQAAADATRVIFSVARPCAARVTDILRPVDADAAIGAIACMHTRHSMRLERG